MITIPLKLKYRNPNLRIIKTKEVGEPESGTMIFMGTKNQANPGSAVNGRIAGMRPKHSKTNKKIAPRKRAYGPF